MDDVYVCCEVRRTTKNRRQLMQSQAIVESSNSNTRKKTTLMASLMPEKYQFGCKEEIFSQRNDKPAFILDADDRLKVIVVVLAPNILHSQRSLVPSLFLCVLALMCASTTFQNENFRSFAFSQFFHSSHVSSISLSRSRCMCRYVAHIIRCWWSVVLMVFTSFSSSSTKNSSFVVSMRLIFDFPLCIFCVSSTEFEIQTICDKAGINSVKMHKRENDEMWCNDFPLFFLFFFIYFNSLRLNTTQNVRVFFFIFFEHRFVAIGSPLAFSSSSFVLIAHSTIHPDVFRFCRCRCLPLHHVHNIDDGFKRDQRRYLMKKNSECIFLLLLHHFPHLDEC